MAHAGTEARVWCGVWLSTCRSLAMARFASSGLRNSTNAVPVARPSAPCKKVCST
jgi:hypothetical protein